MIKCFFQANLPIMDQLGWPYSKASSAEEVIYLGPFIYFSNVEGSFFNWLGGKVRLWVSIFMNVLLGER